MLKNIYSYYKKIKTLILFKKVSQSPTTCLFPFVHLNFVHDGSTAPCFATPMFGSIEEENADWNSKTWTQLRKDLLGGVRNPLCKKCWNLEDSKARSYRQASLEDYTFRPWRDAFEHYDFETGQMFRGPKQIELRFSNKCNLECPICSSLYSTRWEKRHDADPHLQKEFSHLGIGIPSAPIKPIDGKEPYKDQLFEKLKKWSHEIENILISGGEPLMQKEHYEALDLLAENSKNIVLDYTTNLSTVSYKGRSALDDWKTFKAIGIKISMDGDPLIYPYVRKYSNLKVVEKNITRVFANVNNLVRFQGSLTASAFNIHRIVECIEYFTSLGLQFHTSQVHYPDFLSTQILPLEEKKRITDRAMDYLEKLEKNLSSQIKKNSTSGNILWDTDNKITNNLRRIRTHTESTINFMNGKDRSQLMNDFFKYDKLLNPNPVNGILKYYPQISNYS